MQADNDPLYLTWVYTVHGCSLIELYQDSHIAISCTKHRPSLASEAQYDLGSPRWNDTSKSPQEKAMCHTHCYDTPPTLAQTEPAPASMHIMICTPGSWMKSRQPSDANAFRYPISINRVNRSFMQSFRWPCCRGLLLRWIEHCTGLYHSQEK